MILYARICVLTDSEKYPRFVEECRFQSGLKAKDGTLASEVNKNILVPEIARVKVQSWLLFCEDKLCFVRTTESCD